MAPTECQTPILSPMILRPPPRSHCGDSPRASSASPTWAPLLSKAVNHLSDRTCPPYTWLPGPSSWGHASSLRATPHPCVPAGTPSLGSRHPENWLPMGTWQARPLSPRTQAREGCALKAPPHLPCPPPPPGEPCLLTRTTGPRWLVLEGGGHPAHRSQRAWLRGGTWQRDPGHPEVMATTPTPQGHLRGPGPQAPLRRGGGDTAGAAGAQSWG